MGFNIEIGVSASAVFIQGLLSFFSPCVLPLVPLYIGYLAGGTKTVGEDGRIKYSRQKVMMNTLFFVLGISFAFFLLGLGFTAAGRFFGEYRTLFARVGGILIILFGLYQLGVFGFGALGREYRLPFKLNSIAMNPLLALALGFTFSFAWTPCVGPALASVLLMVSSAASQATGLALIGIYTLGFVIPFLAVGLFTGSALNFFKKHQNVVKITGKIGGVLMIFMGIMMLTGWMNGVTGYLSDISAKDFNQNKVQESSAEMPESVSPKSESPKTQSPETVSPGAASPDDSSGSEGTEKGQAESGLPDPSKRVEAPDFTLTDQFGTEHKLSDYRGKVVFLNFWATWCGPCKAEMPDIQALYEEYGENSGDLVILGVANPKTEDNPNNNDKTIEEITAFMENNGYSYPVPMDTTGDVLVQYYVTAFPTTFMIDRQGRVIGYASGTLTKEIMKDIISQALSEGKE